MDIWSTVSGDEAVAGLSEDAASNRPYFESSCGSLLLFSFYFLRLSVILHISLPTRDAHCVGGRNA